MHLLNLLWQCMLLQAWISNAGASFAANNDQILSSSNRNPWRRLQETESDNPELEHVHFVFTDASLLSGSQLSECQTASDANCTQGVAAVAAYLRQLVPTGESQLILPRLEKSSQFVRAHPLGWNVNRVILQGLLGWKVYASQPSLLHQHQRDGGHQDLSYLQNDAFSLLLSNINIPPSNSWDAKWHEHVHWDASTHIALMVIGRSDGGALHYPQVDSASGLLEMIAEENRNLGHHCVGPDHPQDPAREAFLASYDYLYQSMESVNASTTGDPSHKKCWIPVIVYYDTDPSLFQEFLHAMRHHPHPPAVILDAGQNNDHYTNPTRVPTLSNATTNDANSSIMATTTSPSSREAIWVHSYRVSSTTYLQHQITINRSTNPPSVQTVSVLQRNLRDLPDQFKDGTYQRHIDVLRTLANEAMGNDPVLGTSTAVPNQFRRCNTGQCEIGSLLTDAMKWQTEVDVAFLAGGGLRGPGWPEGPVHTSDLWAALPFPDTLCTGTLSGISLVRLLDYSYKRAYFNDTHNSDADRLLQVSGMRITYNSNIPQGQSKIVSVEILDLESETYKPVDPFKLYSYATIDFLCENYDPFPELLGRSGDLMEGERAGVVGETLLQDAAASYLQQLPGMYNTSLDGRLNDNPEATTILNFDISDTDCEPHEYYSEQIRFCIPCPEMAHVEFSDELVNFQYQLGREATYSDDFNSSSAANLDNNSSALQLEGRIVLSNRELDDFKIFIKVSKNVFFS